jgi:16S rRNA (guanine966-N2)-methyltransferase
LRIISGSHKGRQFNPPKGFKSRPTTDLARESLFNILSNSYQLDGLMVFDFFSGSGSIGFEFASRGAEKVICIEKSFPVYKQLVKNAKEMGLTNVEIVIKDVFRWIEKNDVKADIIFADPPFELKGVVELPHLILNKKLLNSGGCLILEHSSSLNFEEIKEYSYTKKYGAVHFSFFFVD